MDGVDDRDTELISHQAIFNLHLVEYCFFYLIATYRGHCETGPSAHQRLDSLQIPGGGGKCKESKNLILSSKF